ncbi:hypothetical protein EAF04_005780 [Stromatinia cepivora]|nr:hypothetical protein EAF04_005780 [Stromatinia cepivora]
MSSQEISQPFAVGDVLHGHSGRSYQIEKVISERLKPMACVYGASAEGESYIIKNSLKGEFEYQQQLQKPLISCLNVRSIIDTIPDFELFVYHFLKDNLLQFCQRDLPVDTRKGILKNALFGLAKLHDKRILHGDIKPNNILLDYDITTDGILCIKEILIADLEHSFTLLPGQGIMGGKCGNQFWRSPESWGKGRQGMLSDIFSMGIVAVYIMDKQMIFYDGLKDEDFADGEACDQILRRHISYFWDENDFTALLEYIGEDNPFHDHLINIFNNTKNPRPPFRNWIKTDAKLRDLVVKMARLDPTSRISASEALEHPFFHGIGRIATKRECH